MADDETRERISKSQRERYEREAREKARVRSTLHDFAIWISPVWEKNNSDDSESALEAVDAFLAGEERE